MPKIIHCTERHKETNPAILGRKKHAWDSWEFLYSSGELVACHLWQYPRSAKQIGDRMELPYLKDVLEAGMKVAGEDDIILWTNDDTILHPSAPRVLRAHLEKHPAVSLLRCEFRKTAPNRMSRAEDWGRCSIDKKHCGRDAFAFTKAWLVDHWDEIPDFILGASEFDILMTVLIRRQYGIEKPRSELERPIFPAELPRGIIGHIAHVAPWSLRNRYATAPAQKHNQNLYKEAFGRLSMPAKVNRICSDTCVVQLGRYGDIINILPLCRHIATHYGRPSLMVSAAFSDLLSGVSYIEPYVVSFPYEGLRRGMDEAKKHFKHVIQSQIYGNGFSIRKLCDAYNVESWRMAGFEPLFGKLPLVFDCRSADAERKLIDSIGLKDRPTILVGVTGGISSPLPGAGEILSSISQRWGSGADVVDLCSLKSDHLYDLLGLFDRSTVLVTSDTAYLHLAAASTIPVIALTNPKPWYGTTPYCKIEALMTYDAIDMDKIHSAISGCVAERVARKIAVGNLINPEHVAQPTP